MLRRTVTLGVVAVLLVGLLVVGAYAAIAAVTGRAPRLTTTSQACDQPEFVNYLDGTYTVYVTTSRLELGLARSRPEAHIGRGPDHGVVAVLSHGTEATEVTCEWDDDGVTIIDDLGIGHRVPASVFTGGR